MRFPKTLLLTCLLLGVATIAYAHLNIGTFTRLNSKLYSDSQFETSPLHTAANTAQYSDYLRCWVAALGGPASVWKCDNTHCSCTGGNCPSPTVSPRIFQSIPDGIVNQGACDSGNCFSQSYGSITGAVPNVTFSNYDPTNGKHQEAACTISGSGRNLTMVVGQWHN